MAEDEQFDYKSQSPSMASNEVLYYEEVIDQPFHSGHDLTPPQ